MRVAVSVQPRRIVLMLRTACAACVPLVRASVMTYLLLVALLNALPHRPLDNARLRTPSARRIVRHAQKVLHAVGVERSRTALRASAIGASLSLFALRERVVEPLQPALEFFGSRQRWGLFLQGGRSAHRLQIEGRGRADEPWVLLYRAHRYDALALSDTLAYRRVRGIYNPRRPEQARAQYDAFTDWVAGEVMRRRPKLTQVRVSMQRLELDSGRAPSRELGTELERIHARRGAS